MNRLPRSAQWVLFALATPLCVAVCHQWLIPIIPTVSAATMSAQDQAQDPAAANTAPSGPSYTTQAPPAQSAAPNQSASEYGEYGEQPTETSAQAPPPLPDYEQPPPPADGYIWTPGYWAWGPGGYYWVPGAWVEPPYAGALWTPGYWGFYGGRYSFFPGYWGLHIGFYGGINYGFGYVGLGYEGGYWHSGHFFYNSVYNHIDTRVVHNVYRYNAGSRARIVSRASFNGGRGVQARPRPSEMAARREPTAPRMSTQEQHARSYSTNRGQFASQNHGRPATPAISRGIPADHNVRPSNRGGGGGGHEGGNHK